MLEKTKLKRKKGREWPIFLIKGKTNTKDKIQAKQNWEVTVCSGFGQMANQSIPTPDDLGSNPVMDNFSSKKH